MGDSLSQEMNCCMDFKCKYFMMSGKSLHLPDKVASVLILVDSYIFLSLRCILTVQFIRKLPFCCNLFACLVYHIVLKLFPTYIDYFHFHF